MAGKKKPGKAKAAPEKNEEFSLISNATLKALYADLRKCETAVKRAAGKNVIDALPAGVWMDLGDGDAVVSGIADAAAKLKRKGKPAAAVSTEFGLVLGAGLLAKSRKSGKVGVIFGEAGDAEFQEALGIAKRLELPVIFVSRAKAVDEKELARELRAAKKKGKKAKGAANEGYLPRIHVDANDVVAVYRVAHESIDRARRGRGPSWIEGVPFKPEGKRVAADAVSNMEKYLIGKGLL
jgi:pyruvate dehydrogenase E1 component alpha subunit